MLIWQMRNTLRHMQWIVLRHCRRENHRENLQAELWDCTVSWVLLRCQEMIALQSSCLWQYRDEAWELRFSSEFHSVPWCNPQRHNMCCAHPVLHFDISEGREHRLLLSCSSTTLQASSNLIREKSNRKTRHRQEKRWTHSLCWWPTGS